MECLEKAKADRKAVVRYIQLVPDADTTGDFIGSLIATNEQVCLGCFAYDQAISALIIERFPFIDRQRCSTLRSNV